MKIDEKEISIVHVTLTLNVSYAQFTDNVERLLGRFSEDFKADPHHVRESLKESKA